MAQGIVVPWAIAVRMLRGDSVVIRNPTPDQRREYGLAEGEPLVLITRADGVVDGYGAHRVTLVGR